MKIYTFKNINDASIKIKNKIVDVRNQSDSLIPNNYYIFKDGIILNTCLMSYSNKNNNYKPFIQVRYNNNNNSYEIRIQCIIYSNSSGDNFYNNGDTGSIIIYYI